MTPPLSYEELRLAWWALLGVLLIGFAVTDGFDFGALGLLPWVARDDVERRLVINAVGPTWEGNQVWLVLGAGAIFAAWPLVYAAAFSGFYLAMALVLLALIVRPVGFKYRSKRESRTWRRLWDWALFKSGIVPPLVFGVAVGEALSGAPIRFDGDLRITFEGSFLGLFTPFTLTCGLLAVAMTTLHGAAWLTWKFEPGAVRTRARAAGRLAAAAAVLLFAAGWGFVRFGGLGWRVVSAPGPGAPSNPLRTLAVRLPGAWLANYHAHPAAILAPLVGFGGAVLAGVALKRGSGPAALGGSALASAGIISTAGISMFPFLLPSSVDPRSSLTVWNASSSATTLFLMLLASVILLPMVLGYTAWVFRILRGPVREAAILAAPGDFY